MPENPLTKYLLLLASDASEVERFRSGGDVARQSMSAAGLTDARLQDVLLGGDQQAIEAALSAELVATVLPPGSHVVPVQFTTLVQYQIRPPKPEPPQPEPTQPEPPKPE